LEGFIKQFEEFEKNTFFIIAARPNSKHSTFLSVNYELYDISKLKSDEKAEDLINKEMPRFMDFIVRYPVFDYFDQDVYSMLKENPKRKAVVLLYRPKLHSDKRILKQFLNTIKEMDREDWIEENASKDGYFLDKNLIFVAADVMRRLNRPLIKLLDFKFSKFPCVIVLHYDQGAQRLKFKQVEVPAMQHLLYPYGFRQKLTPLLNSLVQTKPKNSTLISELENLAIGETKDFKIGEILEIFPKLRKSMYSMNNENNYIYRIF
jgi:hypothetical protein